MQYSVFSAAALLLPAVVLATHPPMCGPKNTPPCVCPSGTVLGDLTTYATIEARFSDINAIVGSVDNTEWLGLVIQETTGDPEVPGSTRKYTFSNGNVSYDLIEELFEYKVKKNYAHMKYGQQNIPIVIPQGLGSGEFHGFWNTVDLKSISNGGRGRKPRTTFQWNSYHCIVGNPFPFAHFYEGAIKNVTEILRSEGKLYGEGRAPFTVVHPNTTYHGY